MEDNLKGLLQTVVREDGMPPKRQFGGPKFEVPNVKLALQASQGQVQGNSRKPEGSIFASYHVSSLPKGI